MERQEIAQNIDVDLEGKAEKEGGRLRKKGGLHLTTRHRNFVQTLPTWNH